MHGIASGNSGVYSSFIRHHHLFRSSTSSTQVILAVSLLHGYCVVCGMFLSRRLSLTSRYNTATVLSSLPEVRTNFQRSTQLYDGTPPDFSFQFTFYFHPLDVFPRIGSKIFKWSNLLQNINVCPHRYGILLRLALYFLMHSKIRVCPHGWDIHLLSKVLRGFMPS